MNDLLTPENIEAYEQAVEWSEGALPGRLQLTAIEIGPKGACDGNDTVEFFPEKENACTTQAAKMICQQCVVRQDCLRAALYSGENVGVWGGLSTPERKALRKALGESQDEPAA